MEILDGFVCIVFCFLQNRSGLIVGIFQEFFLALINIFLLLLEFIAQLAVSLRNDSGICKVFVLRASSAMYIRSISEVGSRV